MAVTRRRVSHPPSAVFTLLADGTRYAEWVVGAKRVRSVDPGWPEPGTKLHHTSGVGPLCTDDTTEVVRFEPGGPVELEARAWPAGVARVTITAEGAPDGGCEVVIDEVPVEGPAKRLSNPLFDVLIHVRNVESLRRMEQALTRGAG